MVARKVRMRITSINRDEYGDQFVILDPGERVAGVFSGQTRDMAWVIFDPDESIGSLPTNPT